MSKLELYRQILQIGNLYYLDEKLRGKYSESLNLWKVGPALQSFLGEKDVCVDVIYMNVHNPFVLLEIVRDIDYETIFWYKILTKNGKIGWFAIDDEDIKILHLCFREAVVPNK